MPFGFAASDCGDWKWWVLVHDSTDLFNIVVCSRTLVIWDVAWWMLFWDIWTKGRLHFPGNAWVKSILHTVQLSVTQTALTVTKSKLGCLTHLTLRAPSTQDCFVWPQAYRHIKMAYKSRSWIHSQQFFDVHVIFFLLLKMKANVHTKEMDVLVYFLN